MKNTKQQPETIKLLGAEVPVWTPDQIDPAWCYVCDRPKNDCACHLDPDGIQCEKAGCKQPATILVATLHGDFEYRFCEYHGNVATCEHGYSFVRRIKANEGAS